jgi:acetyl-CoA carboxylase biotin carboxyl carrier protein
MPRLTIRSPLPGTFYRRPNPQADPYVKEHEEVKIGDVVGLVEIMKSFHEIPSDAEGRIAAFLVEDATLVDAGQDLITLETAEPPDSGA